MSDNAFNSVLNTLTIVGNGFDLSLGAKTSYESFYNCLKDCYECDAAVDFKQKYTDQNNEEHLDIFYKTVKESTDNYFINYFLRYKKVFGDWVSFETELTKIIKSFDSLTAHLNTRDDYILYFYSAQEVGLFLRIINEVELMSTINVFPDNKFFCSGVKADRFVKSDDPVTSFHIKGYAYSNEFDVYKSISDFTEFFPKELYKDLCVFSDLFVLYLFIVKRYKEDKLVYGPMLDSDFFINYNYTEYLSSTILRSGCKPSDIVYINGKAEDNKRSIVFGIDSNTKLVIKGFEVFTKTVQRSLYDTDICRLSSILKDDVVKIYVFGHSLNLADYESLHFIFSSCEKYDKPEIVVYCYDELAKINSIINLRTILGKEKFDNYQRNNRLSFLNSKAAIVRKKNRGEE